MIEELLNSEYYYSRDGPDDNSTNHTEKCAVGFEEIDENESTDVAI